MTLTPLADVSRRVLPLETKLFQDADPRPRRDSRLVEGDPDGPIDDNV
jgi:hypothetical protein